MRRVEPVIDAWFDSGSMPTAQWGYPVAEGSADHFVYPADFICEAIDQTRGWFYSLLAVNTLVRGSTPYRNVLCLGHIVDADGRKMSKSVGNVIDPWEILDTRGADPLRWWMFSQGSPWTPTRVSLEAIDASMRDTLLTLWNTWSFFTTYASLNGFDPADPAIPAPGDRSVLDRWMLSRLAATVATATGALDGYEPFPAAAAMAELVDDTSNWYVRRSRRRFWRTDPDADPADSLGAQATLHEVLVTMALLLAPMCPFVADRMWRELTDAADGDSVHLADWPELRPEALDPALDAGMGLARRLSSLGRAARAEAGIRVRQPLARALVYLPPGSPTPPAGVVEDELNVDVVEAIDELGDVLDLRAGAQLQAARAPARVPGPAAPVGHGLGGRRRRGRRAGRRPAGGGRAGRRPGRAQRRRGRGPGPGPGRLRRLPGRGRGGRPRPHPRRRPPTPGPGPRGDQERPGAAQDRRPRGLGLDPSPPGRGGRPRAPVRRHRARGAGPDDRHHSTRGRWCGERPSRSTRSTPVLTVLTAATPTALDGGWRRG